MKDTIGIGNRLIFAKHRLDELGKLNEGDLSSVQETARQQPLQEFFFHLVGAVEFLAQAINDARMLGLEEEKVTASKVCGKLPTTDPTRTLLEQLHPNTTGKPLPPDPYSEEGSHFRIMLLRNRVCHHGRNPFHFRRGSDPPCSLFLDPRDRKETEGSPRPALEELTLFWNLVNDKCEKILSMD